MALKVSYAEENGLGGIMYWEYRCDGTGTLTGFLRRELDRGLCPGGKQEPGRGPCPEWIRNQAGDCALEQFRNRR